MARTTVMAASPATLTAFADALASARAASRLLGGIEARCSDADLPVPLSSVTAEEDAWREVRRLAAELMGPHVEYPWGEERTH